MKVQRHSVREQVRRTLAERIFTNVYRPGDRLVELQIARELGTSQGSVREALRELEALRLVHTQPHRGTRVRSVNLKEMREAYLTRGILEEASAGTAAKCFRGDAGPLWAEYKAMLHAASNGEFATQAARNTAFHRLIVEAAGNSVLLRIWDSLSFETRTRIQLSRPGANPLRAAKTHKAIIEALEAGRGHLAGRILREHAGMFAPPPDAILDDAAACATTH